MPQSLAEWPAPPDPPSPAGSPSTGRDFVGSESVSSEPARNVILGTLVAGIREDLVRRVKLDHSPIQKEAGLLRNSSCLLHIMGHNHDSVLRFQLKDQVFYFRSRYRIQRRSRFIH